jgi:hypothetical protein
MGVEKYCATVIVAQQLKTVAEVELDLNLEVTGFEMAEIDTMIEGFSPASEGETDPADAVANPGVPVTNPGDLWVFGWHRLLCGNSLDEKQLSRDYAWAPRRSSLY